GRYARPALDVEAGEGLGILEPFIAGPAHWNLCFDEPLTTTPSGPAEPRIVTVRPSPERRGAADREAAVRRIATCLTAIDRPLVVVGPLASGDIEPTARFLERFGAPVVAEAPSGLRAHPRLEALALRCGMRALAGGEPIGGVLRLGGVPCTRFWRDLEE